VIDFTIENAQALFVKDFLEETQQIFVIDFTIKNTPALFVRDFIEETQQILK
jgi:hypothetical protein